MARLLLHEPGIDPATRVAGLLVVLYAQPLTKIVRLRTDQIHTRDGHTELLIGTSPIRLPAPLDHHVAALTEHRRARTVSQISGDDEWLFPGAMAGRPDPCTPPASGPVSSPSTSPPTATAKPPWPTSPPPCLLPSSLTSSTSAFAPPPAGPPSPADRGLTTPPTDDPSGRLGCSGQGQKHDSGGLRRGWPAGRFRWG